MAALNPFSEVPRRRFLIRMAWPAVAVFVLGLFVMGIVATLPEVQEAARGRGGVIVPPRVLVSGPPVQAARLQIAQTVGYWLDIPDYCWEGKAVNEFQTQQCEDFWGRLYVASGVLVTPFACVAVFLFLALEMLSGFYRKMRRKIEKGEAMARVIVTKPPGAPGDLFSWLACLRPTTGQLADGKQLRFHMPLMAERPKPGQQYAVFDAGKILGKKRMIGMIYAPHIAIIRSPR